jgi:methylated-DNA-[protein]-cysteine S-methyltransferase
VRVTCHPYEAPGWGVGEVWIRDGLLVQHELPSAALQAVAGQTPPPASSRLRAGFVRDLCRRFVEHLQGVPTSYADIELDLEWATPLQREFVAAARSVPWGEVVSYGELAALAGRPGAARAAGSFCAGNRYPLIIPCHRVVAADGIGGYGSAGLALKRRLLSLEGVRL